MFCSTIHDLTLPTKSQDALQISVAMWLDSGQINVSRSAVHASWPSFNLCVHDPFLFSFSTYQLSAKTQGPMGRQNGRIAGP